MEWHCNVCPTSGLYRDIPIHVKLSFNEFYPHKPPSLEFLMENFPHPNVFGRYICLNMLRDPEECGSYSGWTSAYSVQSILLQLQSFLFAENIPQDYGNDKESTTNKGVVASTKERAMRATCSCGHTGKNPKPPLPEEDYTQGRQSTASLALPIVTPYAKTAILSRSKLYLDPGGLYCETTEPERWYGTTGTRDFSSNVHKGTVYFETIVCEGSGFVRCGFVLDKGSSNIGTDGKGWGYGGTGKKCHSGNFSDYAEGFSEGDVIGSALELETGRIVFFKNGVSQGDAFRVNVGSGSFYPAVCARDCCFEVNFGNEGWRCPPKEFQQSQVTVNHGGCTKNYFEDVPDRKSVV